MPAHQRTGGAGGCVPQKTITFTDRRTDQGFRGSNPGLGHGMNDNWMHAVDTVCERSASEVTGSHSRDILIFLCLEDSDDGVYDDS